MKSSILLISFLHFLNAATFRVTTNIDCSYINNRTDSVALTCERSYYYHAVAATNSTGKNSTKKSGCHYDLFESDSSEKNRQNIQLITLLNECDIEHFHSMFENVTKLNVSHISMWYMHISNFNMPNLFEIDFSYNRIEYIAESITDENTKLSVINISHNRLSGLHENQFAGMTELKILDLSYNEINKIHVNAFKSNTKLEVLRLDNNPLTTFDCHIFSPMKNSASITITLDKIQVMQLNCMGCTVGISSGNKSEMVIRISGVKNELRYNKADMKNLRHFAMAENKAENVSKIIELLPSSLQILDLSSSNLTDLDPTMFSHKSGLQMLDLSYNNNLRINNASTLFAPLKNLRTLKIASAHLQNTPDVLQSVTPSLIGLDLSFNYVGKLNTSTLRQFTNLQYLNLSHTNLSNFGFSTFYHQYNLQSLDLSYNNLMKLNFSLLSHNFRYLTELYLEGINLTDVNILSSFVFPKLSKLAISKNQLSCHSLEEFLHQRNDLKFIANPSDHMHINGIDCNIDAVSNEKRQTVLEQVESHVTKFIIFLLCVMFCGYLMVKSKLLPRIKEKLLNTLPAGNVAYQKSLIMDSENI